MRQFIQIYDNALSPERCQEAIDAFEQNEDSHERYDLGRPSFTQFNLSEHKDRYEETTPIQLRLISG